MDTDNPSSSDLTMAPPSAPLATTSTITTTPSSSHTTINSSTAPPSRALLPQPGSSSSATRSPPRLPTTAAIISTIDPRSGSSTPTQQGQNLSPQRSSSLSPRFRELREPAASSSGSSSSSSGSSGVYGSGQSNGVLDAKPSSQLALMLSTALEELDTLKSRHTEEKRRADYWEGLARSFKVVEEAYSMGSSSGSSGSPGHDRSPRVSTISGSSQHHTSDYPPAIVELVSSLHQARYNAECARDDEHARRIVITDLWRQLRDYLDVLERHARDAKLAFDRRAVGLDSGEPIDSDRRETTAGGILVETQRPIPSLRDFEGAGFVYDEKGRLVNRSGQPLPVGVEPIFKYRGERAPETSPFANTVMGPPTLPPFTAASESRTHRKRRSGSVEGSHHGHTGHVHKRSRVNSYLPPPQPIHPPSHPTQPFNLPPNSSSAPNHQNHSPLPSHSTRRSPPLQIPPPPPPQQHFGEVRPQSKGQGQFVPWHPPGHPSSSKQPPPPQQASYPTFNARDLERERQDRERGRPSSLPHESRDRSERGRDRSRSVSSDKSLDDMILDATAPSDQPDQSDISGNQLPPLRYTSSSGVGNGSTKRRSSRERDEREREYHQRRSPPPPHHYLPPPGGPKMYTHPPPPLPPYQNREVFAPGEGRSGDRLEGVVRAGENGQGDPHHLSFSSNHTSHHPHALTAHPTIPNGQSLASLASSSSLTSSHATIQNSSHPSIQTSPNQSTSMGSQSSVVQPGSYPPTNSQGQRICRQCGQAGRYKDGKCVEKWGPGPHGPGTVCDRCRKKMKRVERRGTIEQAQAVAAAQAQAARQQAAVQARAEAARMVAEVEQRERMEERERGRPLVTKDRMVPLVRSDTVLVSPPEGEASPGAYHRRGREREYSSLDGKRTPLGTGSSAGELAPPRTIVPAPGSSTPYRGSPLPPRSSSLRPSSRRSESRSGSGEEVDLDAEGDLDDGDGEGDPESPEVHSSDAGGERDLSLKGPQRIRSRGGSGGSTGSRLSGASGGSGGIGMAVVGVRRGEREQEDPEADLLEAVDAAEQSVKSE